jgi:hypothetical protein
MGAVRFRVGWTTVNLTPDALLGASPHESPERSPLRHAESASATALGSQSGAPHPDPANGTTARVLEALAIKKRAPSRSTDTSASTNTRFLPVRNTSARQARVGPSAGRKNDTLVSTVITSLDSGTVDAAARRARGEPPPLAMAQQNYGTVIDRVPRFTTILPEAP